VGPFDFQAKDFDVEALGFLDIFYVLHNESEARCVAHDLPPFPVIRPG
jgi:hypothetical protein